MSKKIVFLDAGHGKKTPGKRCMKSLDPKETGEWVLNNRIAMYVEKAFKNHTHIEIRRADDPTGKTDVSLSTRASRANKAKADMFIAIHHNGAINGGSGGGTIVFYYSSSQDRLKQTLQLYDCIVKNTGLVGDRYDKVIKRNLSVLRNTNCPAYYLENGFMDSSTDVPIILSDAHARKTAQGLADFICEQFGFKTFDIGGGATTPTPEAPGVPEEPNKDVLHTVQMGAFSNKENAERLQDKLEAQGHDAYITTKERN